MPLTREFVQALRRIFVVCAIVIPMGTPALSANSVGNGASEVPQQMGMPVPQKMLGTWILTDTGQCGIETGKIVITSNAVVLGSRRSDRVAVVPKSGVAGGDTLHWWMSAREEIFEYEADNDRLVWHSRGPDYYTVEYYERCSG